MPEKYDLSRFTQPHIQYVDLVLATTVRGEILPDALMWERPRWVQRIIFSCTALTDDAGPIQANETNLYAFWLRWWKRWREMATGALLPASIICDNADWEHVGQAWTSAGVFSNTQQLAWTFDRPITIPNRDTMFLDWVNPLIVMAGALAAGNLYVSVHGYGKETGKHLVLSDVFAYGASAGGGAAGTAGVVVPGPNSRNDFGEDMIGTRLLIHRDPVNSASGAYQSDILNHLRMGVRFEPSGLVLSTRTQADMPPIVMWGSHRNISSRVAILVPQGEPMIITSRETLGFDIQNTTAAPQARTLRHQLGIVSLVEPTTSVH